MLAISKAKIRGQTLEHDYRNRNHGKDSSDFSKRHLFDVNWRAGGRLADADADAE